MCCAVLCGRRVACDCHSNPRHSCVAPDRDQFDCDNSMGLVVRCFAHRRTSRQRLRRPAGALALLIARTPHLCCLFAFGIANQTHCTSIAGQHGVELEMPVDSDARTQVSNALSVLNLRTEDGTRTHTHARAHTHTHTRTHASFTPTRIHQLTRRPPRPQLRFRITDTAQSARKRFEAEPPEDKSTWGAEHKSALQQVITNINDLQRPAPSFDGLKPEVCLALHSLIGVGRERVLGVARAHELVPSEHI